MEDARHLCTEPLCISCFVAARFGEHAQRLKLAVEHLQTASERLRAQQLAHPLDCYRGRQVRAVFVLLTQHALFVLRHDVRDFGIQQHALLTGEQLSQAGKETVDLQRFGG